MMKKTETCYCPKCKRNTQHYAEYAAHEGSTFDRIVSKVVTLGFYRLRMHWYCPSCGEKNYSEEGNRYIWAREGTGTYVEPRYGKPYFTMDFEHEIPKKAEQGDSDAQHQLGDQYYNGDRLLHSYEEAVFWYKKSAYQGNPWGQFKLAKCYQHGHGIEQSLKKAKEWYAKAAAQGNKSAQKAYDSL